MGQTRLAFLIASISFYLPSLTAAASSSTASETCTPTPISAAITNVTVANSPNKAVVRGVAISVGSPAQDLAFMPYPYVISQLRLIISHVLGPFVIPDLNLCMNIAH